MTMIQETNGDLDCKLYHSHEHIMRHLRFPDWTTGVQEAGAAFFRKLRLRVLLHFLADFF